MTITSSAFQNNGTIPSKFSCDGDGINPPLTISDLPAGTVSIALIVDDPDAPSGTFTHWTLWNIAPDQTTIAEHSVPTGAAQGKTSTGKIGYVSPCPPSGTHRYFFRAFALSKKLNLRAGVSVGELRKEMEGAVVGEAELMGRYQRGSEIGDR